MSNLRHFPLLFNRFSLTLAFAISAQGGELPWPGAGFEEGSAETDWTLHRGTKGAVVVGADARSGTACLEVEGGGFARNLPYYGEGYLAFGGFFRTVPTGEIICLTAPGLKTPSGRSAQCASRIDGSTYFPLAIAGKFREHLLGTARLDVFVKNGNPIWADDFFALDNRIANPSFHRGLEGWKVSGRIEIHLEDSGNSFARLEPNSSLTQRIAAESFSNVSFGCRVRSPSGNSPARMTLAYFDPVGTPVLEASAQVAAGPEWSPLRLITVLPATAVWGELRLDSESPLALEVDDLDHACLSTPYYSFSPNGDGVYDNLPVSAWVDRDATAVISLMDSNGVSVANLFSGRVEGETFWEGGWNGLEGRERAAPAGDYDVHLEIQPEDGAPYSLHRRIALAREPVAESQISNLHLDFFPRGFWMNVHDCFGGENAPASEEAVEAEYDRLFSRMEECHGNAAVPAVLDYRYAAVRRAAEKRRIHQIPSLIKPEMLLRYSDPLEEPEIWKSYGEAIQPWLGSPIFLGTYPLDEPTVDLLSGVQTASRILSTLAPEAPPLFSLTDLSFLQEFLDTVGPPAVLFHDYPCIAGEQNADIESFIRNLELARGEALDRGLPFWAILQTFSEEGRHRAPTPAEFRGMAGIALALGSKGVFSFLFNSSRWSPVEGLLDRDFEGGELLEEVSRVYSWIAENEGLLMRLELAKDCVTVDRPGYVRTLVDETGGVYFFVVNTDPAREVGLELRPLEGFETPKGGIDLAPGEFVLLKAEGSLLEERGRPNLAKVTVETLFSRFKAGAKAVLDPVAGDFDWKQVGRVYQVE